jgi:hypothetical protein
MANRKSTSHDGQNCLRCQGFVQPSSADVYRCACTDALLRQFESESQRDRDAVARLLFLEHVAADERAPMRKRMEYTRESQQLYAKNAQLAIRNGVKSPFCSGR